MLLPNFYRHAYDRWSSGNQCQWGRPICDVPMHQRKQLIPSSSLVMIIFMLDTFRMKVFLALSINNYFPLVLEIYTNLTRENILHKVHPFLQINENKAYQTYTLLKTPSMKTDTPKLSTKHNTHFEANIMQEHQHVYTRVATLPCQWHVPTLLVAGCQPTGVSYSS